MSDSTQDEWKGPEQRQQVIDHLKKSGADKCPSCGSERFQVVDMVVIRKNVLDSLYRMDTMSLIPVICQNCANVRLFFAQQMGIPYDPPTQGGM